MKEVKNKDFKKMLLDGLKDIKEYLIKPFSKKEEKEDTISIGIRGGLLCLGMVIMNMIRSMYYAVHVTSFDWLRGSKTEWKWENLKELNYFSLIFKNFLIYAAILLGIALVFYLGTRIIKKEVKYPRLVNLTIISAIPFVLGNMLLAFLAGFLSAHLAVIIMIITTVYSIALFAMLIDEEIVLKGKMKLYFYTACYASVLIILYIILVNVATSFLKGIGI